MSLRHLYRDLRELGVYPDIIKNNDREKFILSREVLYGREIITIKVGKYYGYTFYMRYNMFYDHYMISIYSSLGIKWSCTYTRNDNILEVEMEDMVVIIKLPQTSPERAYDVMIDTILNTIE